MPNVTCSDIFLMAALTTFLFRRVTHSSWPVDVNEFIVSSQLAIKDLLYCFCCERATNSRIHSSTLAVSKSRSCVRCMKCERMDVEASDGTHILQNPRAPQRELGVL